MPFDPTAAPFAPRSKATPSPAQPSPQTAHRSVLALKPSNGSIKSSRKKTSPTAPSFAPPSPTRSASRSPAALAPSFTDLDFPPLSPSPGSGSGSTKEGEEVGAEEAVERAVARAAGEAEEKDGESALEDLSHSVSAEGAALEDQKEDRDVSLAPTALESDSATAEEDEAEEEIFIYPAPTTDDPPTSPSPGLEPAQPFEPPENPLPSQPALLPPAVLEQQGDSPESPTGRPIPPSTLADEPNRLGETTLTLESPLQTSSDSLSTGSPPKDETVQTPDDALRTLFPPPASPSPASSPTHYDPLFSPPPGSEEDPLSSSLSETPVPVQAEASPPPEPEEEVSALPPPPPPIDDDQRAAILSAISSGELYKLQRTFSSSPNSYFALSNEPLNPHTLTTPLLLAASKGHLEIVKFLVEEGGAVVDLEDAEGENAIHKSSLHAHVDVVSYLLQHISPFVPDREGFTALHNASSKGHEEVVRVLLEKGAGGYDPEEEGELRERGVDKRTKGGWTSLMCAAANGHAEIANLLLETGGADPLVRNGAMETAADVAAGVFCVKIFDLLEAAERERWPSLIAPGVEAYNTLAVHSTVPILVFENQRLDGRLSTRALNGGRAVFSPSGLGKMGRRAKWELRVPGGSTGDKEEIVPCRREDVRLPSRENPFHMPLPAAGTSEEERAHLWTSDFELDLTNEHANPKLGWSYAPCFSSPIRDWTPYPPPDLISLLTPLGPRPPPNVAAVSEQGSAPWVRRRAWVRTMTRRLDLPPLPILERDGFVTSANQCGGEYHDEELQAVGSFASSHLSGSSSATVKQGETADYLAGARATLGERRRRSSSATDIRAGLGGPTRSKSSQAKSKLERALGLLETGMEGDEDEARVEAARTLINEINRRLDAFVPASEPVPVPDDNEGQDDSDSDSESIFVYTDNASTPATSVKRETSSDSPRSRTSPWSVSVAGRSDGLNDFSDVSFPLPQRDAALKPSSASNQAQLGSETLSTTHVVWQSDDEILDCQHCRRHFGVFLRKHHCRRCARIFCDACSPYRTLLPPSQIFLKPDTPFSTLTGEIEAKHRVCTPCMQDPSLREWLAQIEK